MKQRIIGKTKNQALKELKTAFIQHGVIEIETNGNITSEDIITNFHNAGLDFYVVLQDCCRLRLVSNVDNPSYYVECN